MGFGTPGADLQDHGGRLAAVLQVMAIALAGLETGAIAGVEHGFASIGDEHDRAPDNIDELVFVGVPMALTGPAPGPNSNRLTPNWVRPAAIPSRRRVLFRQGSSNGLGWRDPARARATASSIFMSLPPHPVFSRSNLILGPHPQDRVERRRETLHRGSP